MYEELKKKAEEYCRQDDLGHFIRTTEEVKQAYIDGAKENDLQYEMDCLRESKIELEKNFEKLLHELRDRNIVNWWLNGEGYHWEFNKDVRRKPKELEENNR